jgi:hypothetical protein
MSKTLLRHTLIEKYQKAEATKIRSRIKWAEEKTRRK